MCTAVTYRTKDHYFGRNLDLEYGYEEAVTVAPRNFPFCFRAVAEQRRHYALIGMATVQKGYPLYYDATNEKGLSMAGLSFPDNAVYRPYRQGADNVAPFELIPWLLGQCATVEEAEKLLERLNLLQVDFDEALPLSPLHWMLADRERSVVIEPLREGLRVCDDPVGVLTNNPPFDWQLLHLQNYMGLSRQAAVNRFAASLELRAYSRGMGAMGLPGDLSSSSRFVRAAFARMNAVSGDTESESVSQVFHILGSVAQQRGCVELGEGVYEITTYSSCCNTDKGVYYYTTYENSQITGVDMHREEMEGDRLIAYPRTSGQRIYLQNATPPNGAQTRI